MDLSRAMVTLRTVRHLRYSQVLWRLRYMVERRLRLTSQHQQPPPDIDLARIPEVPVLHHLGPDSKQSLDNLRRGEFEFLNHRRRVSFPELARAAAQVGIDNRLWNITLQYHQWFYDLAVAAKSEPAAYEVIRTLMNQWLDAASGPESSLPFAWNAYAIATRAGWWARAFQVLGHEWVERERDLASRLIDSLSRQIRHLDSHIEWDLRANHVLRDAVGLAWAGRFFRGPEADQWMNHATAIALDQIAEQTLPDGAHFERSTMYHILAMEDVLTLGLLLTDPSAQQEMARTWERMAEYLSWIIRPDQRIPLFNDGAHHAACDPLRMLGLGGLIGMACYEPVTRGARLFPNTGMAVCHGDPWTVFFDVGAIEPAYQPGHAHADNLTLEICAGQRPFVIDPGTYAYDDDARRAYVRGTASHNTVCIDEANSSEVWHIFRVGRRAKPCDIEFRADGDNVSMAGSHTGYDHLPGSPKHCRRIDISHPGDLVIHDQIQGSGTHRLEGGFLLDPSWSVKPAANGWIVSAGDQSLHVSATATGQLEHDAVDRPYYPEFGIEQTTKRLVWRTTCPLPVDVTIRFSKGSP